MIGVLIVVCRALADLYSFVLEQLERSSKETS